ncbi:MAG: tetratricopeptide repeat protein [Myxococcales bacterium]|nr:tetratricopeptide repeat protein [Myxococcales bacterium]MCB9547279.1 tetratricopeptide repeat protein [Myxococcales bacterium]
MKAGRAALAALLAVGCGPTAPRPDAPPVEAPISAAPAPEAEAPASEGDGEAPAAEEPPPLTPAQIEGRAKLLEARQAASRGELPRAIELYGEALSADEALAEAPYNQGVIAERQGDDAEARRRYEQALDVNPEFEPAVTAIANLLLRTGKASDAAAYTRQALARKPASLALRNAANRVRLFTPGQTDAVIQDTKVILREDEKNVAAMINLAAAYHQQGKYELSVAILENAKALDPRNPEIMTRAALAHEALGESIKARLALEEAVGLPGGGSAEAHNNLGLIYHAAGDYEGAGDHFQKALERAPEMLAAQINLGNALRGQQRYTDAVKAFLRALKMQPDSPEAYFNLGILYLDGDIPEIEPKRRLEKAVTYFERYKQLRGQARADDPVEQYIAEAKKRIEVEEKRAAQARRTPKAPDAAPASDGEAPAAPAEEEEEEQ